MYSRIYARCASGFFARQRELREPVLGDASGVLGDAAPLLGDGEGVLGDASGARLAGAIGGNPARIRSCGVMAFEPAQIGLPHHIEA
jgi:hypothetical protein